MKCRGRPRSPRRVECSPEILYFKPRGVPLKKLETISIALEELEALRLVDVEGMTQEEAAFNMGVSRRAFWEDLQNARKKVATALTYGKAIEIGDEKQAGTVKEQ